MPAATAAVGNTMANPANSTEDANAEQINRLAHAPHVFSYSSPRDRPLFQPVDSSSGPSGSSAGGSSSSSGSSSESKTSRALFQQTPADRSSTAAAVKQATPVSLPKADPNASRSFLYRLTSVVAHVTDPPEKDSALSTINGEHLVSHILVRNHSVCLRVTVHRLSCV